LESLVLVTAGIGVTASKQNNNGETPHQQARQAAGKMNDATTGSWQLLVANWLCWASLIGERESC
jgi:hypothetical protein